MHFSDRFITSLLIQELANESSTGICTSQQQQFASCHAWCKHQGYSKIMLFYATRSNSQVSLLDFVCGRTNYRDYNDDCWSTTCPTLHHCHHSNEMLNAHALSSKGSITGRIVSGQPCALMK